MDVRPEWAYTTLVFDLALCFWRTILSVFFRSIQPRGSFHIPNANDGTAVIFAGAPHHNQFLDPLLLSSEAKRASGRRVSFLTAEKSLQRKFIGPAARMMGSISVVRAADRAKPGVGRITFWPSEEGDTMNGLRIKGYDTQFSKQLEPRGQLVLPQEYGYSSAEVAEVVSATECILKRPFKDVPNKLPVQQALSPLASAALSISSAREESEPLMKQPPPTGSTFTVFPHIDQSLMYAQVFKKLNEGGSLGIFPEGGSHDRTDLLPLKRGVVIMALGAIEANPELKVRIVPVGLSYFHPHKFRSRAVVEFGSGIEVPADLVKLFAQGGQKKREAVEKMMDIVYDGIKSVTVRAPDYETLQLIQACRRLYVPPGATLGSSEETILDWETEQMTGMSTDRMAPSTHTHLTLGQVVDLNRRFILGYMRFQDDPRVQQFKASVLVYNRKLIDLGFRDHQVEKARQANLQVVGLLLYRVFLLILWGTLAFPGFILNAPIFVVAKAISHKKAKEALAASQVKLHGRDVLATWKILVSLGMAPILYSAHAIALAYYLYTHDILPQAHTWWLAPLSSLAAMPLLAYSTIKFGEAGADIYKSLPPLLASLIPGRGSQIESLKQTRRKLSRDLQDLIDELAPQIWPDYEQYKQSMIDRARRKRLSNAASLLAPHVIPSKSESVPPGAWIDDEVLFGWRASSHARRSTYGIHSPFLTPQAGAPSPTAAGRAGSVDASSTPAQATDQVDVGAIPELSLPLAAPDRQDDDLLPPQDESEYRAAMDLAALEVGDYASTLTLAAQARAENVKAKQATAQSRRTALVNARHNLSHSISRFFPPKLDPVRSSSDTQKLNDAADTSKQTSISTSVPSHGKDTSFSHRQRTRSHTLEEDVSVSDLRKGYMGEQDSVTLNSSEAKGKLVQVPFKQAAQVLGKHAEGGTSTDTPAALLPPLRPIPKLDDIAQASRTPSRPASPTFT